MSAKDYDNLKNYHVPKEEVDFTGVLIAKKWDTKRPCIVLYLYDAEHEKNYILRAWWRSCDDPRGSYRIKGYEGDISKLAPGSLMKCSCRNSRNGQIKWDTVCVLDERLDEEKIR